MKRHLPLANLILITTFQALIIIISKPTQGCQFIKGNKELNCPNFTNREYVLEKTHSTNLKLQCENQRQKQNEWKFELFNETSIKEFDLSKIESLEITDCPLTKEGFKQLLTAIFPLNPKLLTIYFPITTTTNQDGEEEEEEEDGEEEEEIILTKKHLEGLKNVEELQFFSYNVSKIEKDAFEQNSTKIRSLKFQSNNLQEIPSALIPLRKTLTKLRLINGNISKIDNLKQLENLQLLSLDSNKIKKFENDSFAKNTKLQALYLDNNQLEELPINLFKPLKNLKWLQLNKNLFDELNSNLFVENRKTLEQVTIFANLKPLKIQDYLFANFESLKVIKIMSSQIRILPNNLFFNSSTLQEIYLNYNLINKIPDHFFPLEVKKISLDKNLIEKINITTFEGLQKLEELSLLDNRIEFIDSRAFDSNTNLTKLNLSGNRLISFELKYDVLPNLKLLLLNNNRLKEFDSKLFGKNKLQVLEATSNEITQLKFTSDLNTSSFNLDMNLSENPIKSIDFTDLLNNIDIFGYQFDSRNIGDKKIKVRIENIKLECDCNNLGLLRYLNHELDSTIHSMITLIFKDKSGEFEERPCKMPNIRNIKSDLNLSVEIVDLKSLQYFELICPEHNPNLCPENCVCSKRPWDKALIIDCSKLTLKEPPKLKKEIKKKNGESEEYFNQTIINLSGNNLIKGPTKEHNYENVTNLNLSSNFIEEFNWIPPNIQILDISNNRLQTINEKMLKELENQIKSNLSHLFLSNNSWECNCSTLDLTHFLIRHQTMIKDISNMFCSNQNNKKLVINLEENEVCKNALITYLILAIFLSIIFLIIAISSALYYKYEEEVKVYLYSKRLFLWWVGEDDLDKEKAYDAFISYSHHDRDFVEEKLVPALESGVNPYKLLLHYRDWIPGELISRQIINSVQISKRTVVVVSENFLKSDWGQLEFKTAHLTAMTENRPRVLVIIYGKVNEKEMPDEIKSYVNTRTFIKWGESSFWEKLKYNLPHKKEDELKKMKNEKKEKKMNKKEKKVHNVMSKIDKIDLISYPSSPNNNSTTTPPITLDPLLLKRQKMDFIV